jgi:hypothetical protein
MPPRCSAPLAAEADNAATALPLSPLPHAIVLDIFARLPVDARARCACVCRGWRAVTSEPSLWRRLDLSPSSGVSVAITDAVLRGATARARGGLAWLDVSGCADVTHEALLAMLRANAATLSELRISNPDDYTPLAVLEALLAAAPRLTRCEADVICASEQAPRLLRNEPPYGALRVRRLAVDFADDGVEAHALLPPLCAAVSAHASLTSLQLHYVSLAAPATLDAVVDAVLASRLHTLDLYDCGLCPASTPALVRLLRGGTLLTFHLHFRLLDAPSAALLADALRENNMLTELSLQYVRLWHDEAAAATTLLGALTGHPSLRSLDCCGNDAGPNAAAAGAVLGSLIAANAPALTELDISYCGLRDAGMAPLISALAANTHLRKLPCFGNDTSEAFARNVLLPAVRANTGLRSLVIYRNDVMTVREAAALVAARARAADGAQ